MKDIIKKIQESILDDFEKIADKNGDALLAREILKKYLLENIPKYQYMEQDDYDAYNVHLSIQRSKFHNIEKIRDFVKGLDKALKKTGYTFTKEEVIPPKNSWGAVTHQFTFSKRGDSESYFVVKGYYDERHGENYVSNMYIELRGAFRQLIKYEVSMGPNGTYVWKTVDESILGDQDEIMDDMEKGAAVVEYNTWLRRNSTNNLKITKDCVQFIDGEIVIEHPSAMIDIRELPPYRVVLKRNNDIHASVGTNRYTAKAGVTLAQQMQALRKIIEDSGGYEIAKFILKNNVCEEKTIDANTLTALGPIEIKQATLYTGEATVKLPYIWRCNDLEIYCNGHGDVYMTGIPVGVKRLNITRK